MWMIIGKSEDETYPPILGIYKDLEKAEEYLSSNLIKEFFFSSPVAIELKKIPAIDYPIFMIWDFHEKSYTYVDIDTLSDKLVNLEKVEDDDEQYFIVDIFNKDYQAIQPGEKYFKFVNHEHVTNATTLRLIQTGLIVLSADGLDGNYQCCECRSLSNGILTTKGYAPPHGWQIIPENEGSDRLITVCSEDCKKFALAE